MKSSSKEKLKKIALWLLDVVLNVAIVLGAVLLLENFLITPFDISGPSMCDTLNLLDGKCSQETGERIILNKAVYYVSEPERGDIIVFVPKTSSEKYLIKRVIGLPGETVEILNGYVYITNEENPTGVKLKEEYLNETSLGHTRPLSGTTIFQVPEGEYFVLGDNRNSSTDSRSCFQSNLSNSCKENPENAFVPVENIDGKAWVVFWPLSSWRALDNADYSELKTLP